jgi:hypothetical protein
LLPPKHLEDMRPRGHLYLLQFGDRNHGSKRLSLSFNDVFIVS